MTSPMENVWLRIRNEIREYVVNGVPDADHAVIFNAYPGSGKTTNAIYELMQTGHPFIYLAPNHDVIEENLTFHELQDYIGAFVHLKGRKHLCYFEEYRRMAADPPIGYNMPIKPFCSSCVMRTDGCEYYARRWEIEKENPPSWAGVHSHITTYLHDYIYGHDDVPGHANDFDVLVIEENPISSLMEKADMHRQDMVVLEDVMGSFVSTEPQEQYDLYMGIIDFLFTKIGRTMDYERLWRYVIAWREYNWKKFKEEWDSFLVLRIMSHENPLRIVPKDFILLLDNIFQHATRETLPYHVLCMKESNTGEDIISLNYFHGDILRRIPLRVVGLDGTANIEVWERMIGKIIHEIRITYLFENVYQLEKFKYPQLSWLYKGVLRETAMSLLELTELIVRTRKGGVLLIGTKKIKPYVEKYFREKGLLNRIEFAWYYNLRSKNFLHCDTVVLLMRPSPPPTQLEIYTNLSGWEQEVWQNYYTKDEMLQALARIRPNLIKVKDAFGKERTRDKVEIFIFSGEDLFRPGDVKDGTYYTINKPTMKDFLLRGISSPIYTTRDEMAATEKVLEVLACGDEMDLKELKDKCGCNDKIMRRVTTRLSYSGKIYCRGNKYGLVG